MINFLGIIIYDMERIWINDYDDYGYSGSIIWINNEKYSIWINKMNNNDLFWIDDMISYELI